MKPHSPCPCGSDKSYDQCCGRFVDQAVLPETAEQLMRSRYTAYTLGNASYLQATWHESTRPATLDLEPVGTVKWLGLRILRVEEGLPGDAQGRVCFIARWRSGGGPAQRMEECGRFVLEGGRWLYLDGAVR